MGFEPTRAEPIGLAVQRLNHSATSSQSYIYRTIIHTHERRKLKKMTFPRRESNPGPLGESQIS